MAEWRRGIALVAGLMLWTLAGGAVSSHQPNPRMPRLAVVDYQLVSASRVGRGPVHEYVYRARLKNRGAAIAGATATLHRGHGDFLVVDGTLTFGPVASGASALSLDTFSFRHRGPKGLPGHGEYLRWKITPDAGRSNRPPVADAGPDVARPVGLAARFDGSGSNDPDGDALHYRWELRSKPAASRAVLTGADTVTPSLVVDAAGTYQAVLVVADGLAESAPDTVTVTTPNQVPVANAGPDGTVPVGSRAPLSGVGSTDPDGDPLTYRWLLASRPAGSATVLEATAGVNTGLVPDLPGRYAVHLVVNDGRADSVADEVVVSTSNSAPVARAGADQTAAVGDVVRLDGSTSSDVDGDTLRFAWTIVSRPAGSAAAPINAADVTPSVSIDKAGVYRLRLVVNDGVATSAPDEMEINTRNTAPVANAGSDAHVALGDVLALDGSGSSDVDGDVLTFAWSLTSVPAGSAAAIDVPSSVTPRFAVDVPGTYVAQLIVSDGVASSAADTVVVTTRNTAPVARAGADQAAVAGRRVALDGNASSDAEGTPLSFTWSFVAVPTGSTATLANPVSSAPWFTADRDGLYVVQLVVGDGELSSEPDTVSISTTNTAPVAQAGSDQLDAPVGGVVALDGGASSDADGHALTYRWALIAVPAGSAATLSDERAAAPSFTADRPGEYVAQLVVNDGLLDSAPDAVLVRTANRTPVAAAGSDQNAVVGTAVALDGTGSTDPDGDSLVLDWQLVGAPAGSASTLSVTAPGRAGFTPDVAGRYTARLTATDAGGATAVDDVEITVVTPGALDAPAALAFGLVQVGSSSSQSVTLTNGGGSPVGAITATVTGDFAVDAGPASTCLAGPVAPGASCDLRVTFSPTVGGLREGTLSVDSDGAGGPDVVALSGDGLAMPLVTVVAIDGAASEGGSDTATFRFSRAGGSSGALTIRYAVTGTAANDGASDFTPYLPGDLTFSAGQSFIDVVVTANNDGLVEGAETVVVSLIDDTRYNVGAAAMATVTIVDAPTPIVTVAVQDAVVSEAGPDHGVVRFTRTGDVSTSLTVSYTRGGTATNGTDYVNIGGTITIPAGQATADRVIMPVNDALVEGPETVIVTLVDGANYDLGAGTLASVTIADQPVPLVSVQAVVPNASEVGPSPGTFRFTRVGDTAFSLAVVFARTGTASNSDFVSIGASVTIPAGQASVDVNVTPVTDGTVEMPETVIVTVTDRPNYDLGSPSVATVTIRDN